MATYEASKYDFSAGAITGIQALITGTIIPWSSSSIPSGYLECAGTAVSRTTYADLFAAIGTTYGSGDGSTTFNVPDLRDKVVKCVSNSQNAGTTGGGNTATPNSHSYGNTSLSNSTIPSHNHNKGSIGTPGNYSMTAGGGNRATQLSNINTNSTGSGSAHNHSVNTGSLSSTLQPYIAVIYLIKT